MMCTLKPLCEEEAWKDLSNDNIQATSGGGGVWKSGGLDVASKKEGKRRCTRGSFQKVNHRRAAASVLPLSLEEEEGGGRER